MGIISGGSKNRFIKSDQTLAFAQDVEKEKPCLERKNAEFVLQRTQKYIEEDIWIDPI